MLKIKDFAACDNAWAFYVKQILDRSSKVCPRSFVHIHIAIYENRQDF